MHSVSTIFAVSSGHGRAGVAVVRLSGPACVAVIEAMAAPVPKPRYAAFRRLRHPATGEVLDEGLVLLFAGPKTETGEDMAELHIHGGRAVIAAILGAVGGIAGCRPAEPGEFARRAFHNGKIDLTAAEGLADLIDAETEAQRRQAVRQLAGGVGVVFADWRSRLVEAMALVEASIDFADEGDVATDAMGGARQLVGELAGELRRVAEQGRRGEMVRDGFRVVLAGPPNAGKSSLLNALAQRDAAIVSEEPGTTRDVIEVRLDLGGLAVIVSDTAGVREAPGAVEREGVRRTLAVARDADLVLWLADATGEAGAPPADLSESLLVATKVDLTAGSIPPGWPAGTLALSVRTGLGLDALQARIEALARERAGDGGDAVLTQARHRALLDLALDSLDGFLGGDPATAELRAEDLRQAAAALGRITGHVGAEEVLGAIFGRFCIGK